MNNSTRTLIAATMAACTMATAMPMTAEAADPFQASQQLSEISAASVGMTASVVVSGSLSVLAASGNVVVASVETVGAATVVVLEGASEAGRAVVRVADGGLEASGLVVGGVVELSAAGTGYVLRSAGKIIAFIPDQVGYALLHSTPFASDR